MPWRFRDRSYDESPLGPQGGNSREPWDSELIDYGCDEPDEEDVSRQPENCKHNECEDNSKARASRTRHDDGVERDGSK